MSMTNINGAKYYYELHGEDHTDHPPLVLISGLWADHRYWRPIILKLTDKFRVLIFDNRGIGKTEDNSENFNIDSMADDTVALLEQVFGNELVNIVGQSMGSAIAQSIASRYPCKLKKLVLLNSTPKWHLVTVEGLRALLLSFKDGASFDQLFSSVLAWGYGQAFISNKEKVQSLRTNMSETEPMQTIIDQERQFSALEEFQGVDLAEIKVPTLIGYGYEDKISSPDEAKELKEKISNSMLLEFPGAHGIILEALEELTLSLIDFLSKDFKHITMHAV
ncbi:MAG: alpha/beta hydrolase [Gammaproteobacteria bacterium]|nr:alpha/beta hydrolase [Gammaproteobacteria bacterium]